MVANIFEQYGIKEVADITIYAIELDKYDNEVYIPIMYLDSLKVSALEQTAEQTAANGGIGNPDLIVWDFGKEITLNLEDALFTPASQSLMWGAKFGVNKPKIQGLWNPIVYPKDRYGRTQYFEKKVYPNFALKYVLSKENIPIKELRHNFPYGILTYEDSVGIKQANGIYIQTPQNATDFIRRISLAESESQPLHSAINNEIIEKSDIDFEELIEGFTIAANGSGNSCYLVDEYGAPIDADINVINFSSFELEDESVVTFICPCDNSLKTVCFTPFQGEYKYESLDDYAVGYKCPKGYNTGERESFESTTAELIKSYYWNMGDNSIVNELNKKESIDPNYKGRPERAELIADNYKGFNFNTYLMEVLKGELNDGVITIDTEGTENFCIYTPIDEQFAPNNVAYSYEWNAMDMKMISFEGEQDICYLENANLRYRVPCNSTQKEIMISREGFYETIYSQNEWPQWIKANEEELMSIMDLTRQNNERQSYGYFINPYDSTIDFYLNLHIQLPVPDSFVERYIRIPLGRFYIIADWNFGGNTAFSLMYPIQSGLENVKVLDRTEECVATQTFAIDVNKNLAMANYFNMEEYAEAPLTVFLNPESMKPYEPNADVFIRQNGAPIFGNLRIIKQHEVYYKQTRTIAPEYTTLGHRIIVDAQHFPGTYRIVGETYARTRADGSDERYQFDIPLAKLSPDTSISLASDGEPATFSMKFRVLRRDDGVMMKLTQYQTGCNFYGEQASGSTKVVPTDVIEDSTLDTVHSVVKEAKIRLVAPPETTREFTENLAEEVAIIEDIQAILDTTITTTTDTYRTQTLQSIEKTIEKQEATEVLDDTEYNIRVENLDEEVGE